MRFLAGRIDYERALSMPNSEAAFKLDRMRALLRRLGDPHEGPPILHVAGTKGKGSTAAMLAGILTAAGYRTGRFTSPHIERIEERIAVDGEPCSSDEFAELIEEVRPAIEILDREAGDCPDFCGHCGEAVVGENGTVPLSAGPTYFEILTAMAWLYFARRRVDAVVLEVGLGGRLDSTNVCRPTAVILSSISLDHTKQLGETLASIAAEKAGIIKPGVPVLSGVTDEEPRAVIRRVAAENGCRLIELGVDFDFHYHPPRHLEQSPSPAHFDYIKPRPPVAPDRTANMDDGVPLFGTSSAERDPSPKHGLFQAVAHGNEKCGFTLNLLGRHQAANAAVAVATVEELRRLGWTIPDAAIERGLAEVIWPARIEVLGRHPAVILDAAHNAASIHALVEVVEESFSVRRRLLIFAASQEKDLCGMLRLLIGRFDAIYFTRYTNNPRAVPPEELFDLAHTLTHSERREAVGARGPDISPRPLAGEGLGVRACEVMKILPTPAEAWAAARHWAGPDDLVCITGSFFLAAEMRHVMAEFEK
jgi:dihydrofolate synthase / folylpolyglutamate synthase